MDEFAGFPTKSRQTPIPNLFFTGVLPFIDDLVELKVTLYLFNRFSWKRGYPRFVTQRELSSDLDLMSSLAVEGKDAAAELARGLKQAAARGTFLHMELTRNGSTERLYMLNTETDRRALASIERGEIDLGAMPRVELLPEAPERRTIYALYEENIGMLSPLIAEELKEAEESYPYEWIVEAFREAVRNNRRRWRYIQRILERWKGEGRPYGDHRRGTEEVSPRHIGAGAARGGYIVKREE